MKRIIDVFTGPDRRSALLLLVLGLALAWGWYAALNWMRFSGFDRLSQFEPPTISRDAALWGDSRAALPADGSGEKESWIRDWPQLPIYISKRPTSADLIRATREIAARALHDDKVAAFCHPEIATKDVVNVVSKERDENMALSNAPECRRLATAVSYIRYWDYLSYSPYLKGSPLVGRVELARERAVLEKEIPRQDLDTLDNFIAAFAGLRQIVGHDQHIGMDELTRRAETSRTPIEAAENGLNAIEAALKNADAANLFSTEPGRGSRSMQRLMDLITLDPPVNSKESRGSFRIVWSPWETDSKAAETTASTGATQAPETTTTPDPAVAATATETASATPAPAVAATATGTPKQPPLARVGIALEVGVGLSGPSVRDLEARFLLLDGGRDLATSAIRPVISREVCWWLPIRSVSVEVNERQLARAFFDQGRVLARSHRPDAIFPDPVEEKRLQAYVEAALRSMVDPGRADGSSHRVDDSSRLEALVAAPRFYNGGNRAGLVQFLIVTAFLVAMLILLDRWFRLLRPNPTPSTLAGLQNLMLDCLPNLGFVGTVLGVSQAMTTLGQMSQAGIERDLAIQQMGTALNIAFDTTLLGLSTYLVGTLFRTLTVRNEKLMKDQAGTGLPALNSRPLAWGLLGLFLFAAVAVGPFIPALFGS